MAKNSKILRRCDNFIEAEAIRIRLNAAGILAVMNGAEIVTAFSYVGAAMGGVKVEVAPEDFDRAQRILEDDQQKAQTLGPWICGKCREQNEATFEVCWKCGKQREDSDEVGRLEEEPEWQPAPQAADAEPSALPVEDCNPYRPVDLSKEDAGHRLPQGDFIEHVGADLGVRRAFRAAVLGMVCFPPILHVYSLYVLLTTPTCFSNPSLRKTTVLTIVIDFAFIAMAIMAPIMLGLFPVSL